MIQIDDVTLHLGDLRDVLPTLPENSVDYVCTDPPYGINFMGRGWDHAVPGPEYWEAVLRVCKPGAMMLAFGGTRTYHRLTCAIEDAGWTICDCLMWLYGSGMSKSGDIGKMIDKSKGAVREVVGTKIGQPGYSLANGPTNKIYGDLNNPEAECAITAPATPEAAKWTGWATVLKPAWEPIVLAMKPRDGTIVHNALTWGVAGMNIDASRVGELGRWPANLLLDEEAAAQLDAQTGILTSGTNCVRRKEGHFLEHGGLGKAGDVQTTYGDSGGASRFFYCSKASKKERGPGNDHTTVKPPTLMEYLLGLLSTPNGGVILDPFMGSGSTLVAARRLGRKCIGIELDPHNYEIAVQRVHGAD